MIPCDYIRESRSGIRGRFVQSGGDCSVRGFARIRPERLGGALRGAWDTTLWFLGWDRARPDVNPAFLRILRASF